MNHKSLLISLLLLLQILPATADIKLPAIISDNMVLQQQTKVLLWGMAGTGKTVSVTPSWSGKKYTVKADDSGNWEISIQTPAAGGPYEISISDGSEIRLKNILIGEVWLCSGQSNMDIPMKGVGQNVKIKDSESYIQQSANEQLRLFRVEHNRSETPLTDVTGSWLEAGPVSVERFSAVGYLFAKQLQEKLGVPVGMIKSAVSGTAIAAWMSEKLLAETFGVPKGFKAGKANASELFNAMIAPLAGYGIKGFLWYQGEGNHGDPERYRRMLPAMVKEWRACWNLGEIPFYYVQIAPYNFKTGKAPYMRQVMVDCMKLIPNSGMAALTDAGEEDNIHPSDKKVVADRLLNWALAKSYQQEGIGYCGPVYRSMKIIGSEITVSFDYAEKGLTTYGKELTNFEIAGKDTIYVQAKARITSGGKVVVSSDAVTEPVAVRYAFYDYVKGELFNQDGLPASSFQTLKKIIRP